MQTYKIRVYGYEKGTRKSKHFDYEVQETTLRKAGIKARMIARAEWAFFTNGAREI